MANKPKMYRFRDRLPEVGEAKAPRAQVTATVDDESKTAQLYLYDVIDSWGGPWGTSASEVATALEAIGTDVETIHVHINSPGGEVYEAIAIKNLLAAHPAKTVAIVDGIAASAASFIAASTDEVVMGENTEFMIHDALMIAFGNAAEFREYAEDLDRVSNNIAAIYAKRAGGTADEWREVMIAEKWYSAEEAVEAGLADRIGLDKADEPEEQSEEAIAARAEAALVALGARATSRAEYTPTETAPATQADVLRMRHAHRQRALQH